MTYYKTVPPCPFCGKQFERLAWLVEHIDTDYSLAFIVDKLLQYKAAADKNKE